MESLDNGLNSIQLIQGRTENPIQQLLITVSEREPTCSSGVYVSSMMQNTSSVFLKIPHNLKTGPSLYNLALQTKKNLKPPSSSCRTPAACLNPGSGFSAAWAFLYKPIPPMAHIPCVSKFLFISLPPSHFPLPHYLLNLSGSLF